MLIYNYKKEFLGIDEDDLKAFGFSNLADLHSEVDDFADLFVKTPGFIHNFKHVHWIDYIVCNESGTESKAVINVKGKNYTTAIEIKTIYLIDNPSQKAFIVNFPSIRTLSGAQSEKISADIAKKQEPKTTSSYDKLNPNIVKDVYEEVTPKFELGLDTSLEVEEEEKYKDFVAEPIVEKVQETVKAPVVKVEKITQEEEAEEEKDTSPFANYVFDPRVASQDLGLPIDLVEEFIQDFIAQANSFKNELYESAKAGNIDNLKIQSHKLKGVAANLRVEDALDALTIINSSKDDKEIKANLNRLYRIIDKLSNKGGHTAEPIADKAEVEEELVLSFKNDYSTHTKEADLAQDMPITKVDDSQVPDSIDVAELADDEFLKPKVTISEPEVSDADLSMLDNPADNVPESIKEKIPDTTLLYNKKQVAHDIGLSIESFNELFEDYLSEAKELSKLMIDSTDKDDLRGCKSAAIKLKGMSENMRIHDFDTALEAIINSVDALNARNFVENIISKLNLISNTEDK